MIQSAPPYFPPPSLTPFEAFRLGAAEGRAEAGLSASRALIAEGRRVAARLTVMLDALDAGRAGVS